MKKYAFFWMGTFFMCSTFIVICSTYVVYTEWQVLWSEGFKDFRSISAAIVSLEKTARPASDTAPQMLVQMKSMNDKLERMNNSVGNMQGDISGMREYIGLMGVDVKGLSISVYNMSHSVPVGMDRMKNQMNPMSMMNPFSW